MHHVSLIRALQTGWGTRAGIGDARAATAAADAGAGGGAGYTEKLPDTPSYPQNQYPSQPFSPQPPQQQYQQQQQYYQQPPVELQTGYAR